MSRSDRIFVAAIGGTVVLALAAGLVLLAPFGASTSGTADTAVLLAPSPSGANPLPSAALGVIVVDVAGAVGRARRARAACRTPVSPTPSRPPVATRPMPTSRRLPHINLAQPLTGRPAGSRARAWVTAPPQSRHPCPPAAGGGGVGGGALVNVNTATPEELEALPGIGAVTVQKIVAARQERPFSSLEDMVDRGVIHRGQLEDITGLATAG